MKEKLNKIAEEELEPKEIFIRQVEMQYQEIYANREMITMHFTERSLVAKSSMKKFFISQERGRQDWLQKSFLAMYGEQIKPYVYDVSILFSGMMMGYQRLLIIGKAEMDLRRLSESVVKRLDDIVQGILAGQEPPILSKSAIESVFEGLTGRTESPESKVITLLLKMKSELDEIGLNGSRKEELAEALDFLLKEIKSDDPKRFVMKGMLAHFKGIQPWNKYRKQIAELLKIDLI
jgi:hypothetical protein